MIPFLRRVAAFLWAHPLVLGLVAVGLLAVAFTVPVGWVAAPCGVLAVAVFIAAGWRYAAGHP